MAPRKRVSDDDDEEYSNDFYRERHKQFHDRLLSERRYDESTRAILALIKKRWESYFGEVINNDPKLALQAPEDALKAFSIHDLEGFFHWMCQESRGAIGTATTLQTYWNTLGIYRREKTGILGEKLSHQWINLKLELIETYNLRTEPKEKPILRVEDEFECLKTLWSSPKMKFAMERVRIMEALIMQLGGITGNRIEAILQLKYKDVTVALLPDPHGGVRPRPIIDWKFTNTKSYLGPKDANKFPVPDIREEPCLLLCSYMTFLALAFLDNAFAVPDFSPETFYSLKVLPGQGQLPIPWKAEKEDMYIFRAVEITEFGPQISKCEHFQYSHFYRDLIEIGELTGFEHPLGSRWMRRGNGEGLNSSDQINDDQRNLCLQHGAGSLVFQLNYLNHHVTADTQAAYRNIPPQTALIRAATGSSRTIDKRRPRRLTLEQEKLAHAHPEVQSRLRKKMEVKAEIKAQGETIESCKGTPLYAKYQQSQRDYASQFKFQKGVLLRKIKEKYKREQPVLDIQNQMHGVTIMEQKDADLDVLDSSIAERVEAMNALLTITTSSSDEDRKPEEEIERRVRAINALIALGQKQDGHRHPVRRGKQMPVIQQVTQEPSRQECKPMQCFICYYNPNPIPPDQRNKEFNSRGALKKHLCGHVNKVKDGATLVCPHDGAQLFGVKHVLNHAHQAHNTPTVLDKQDWSVNGAGRASVWLITTA